MDKGDTHMNRRAIIQRHRLSRRRLVGGLAAGLTTAAAVSCSNSLSRSGTTAGPTSAAQSAAGTPRQGGTFNIDLVGNATNLDPQTTASGYTLDPVGAVAS